MEFHEKHGAFSEITSKGCAVAICPGSVDGGAYKVRSAHVAWLCVLGSRRRLGSKSPQTSANPITSNSIKQVIVSMKSSYSVNE